MYFLYLLILCYTSILLTPVNTYVVLTANLNDFQSLAKKYVPKNLVRQVKAMVLENGHKYYEESSKDDEQVDKTVEYLDDSQQDDSYEVTKELETKQSVNRYQLKGSPKVALPEPIVPLASPTVLTIDDIVEKIKQRLFQQILDKSVNERDLNAQANIEAGSSKTGDSVDYKYFPKKSYKATETKAQVETPVNKPVLMKVKEEEVLFEATYEDIQDKVLKPQTQYPEQMSPKNNRFVNTQYEKDVKKVRFVKQVLVPANSNQGQSAYVSQSSMVQQPIQQPSLAQQQSIVQHSNLEPQLNLMQQPSGVQNSMYPQLHHQANIHQSTIIKQLVLIQQQIQQLNRTMQQKELKMKRSIRSTSPTVLEVPQLNIEAVEANFELVPKPTADVQKKNDVNEDQVKLSIEEAEAQSALSEESNIASVVTEPSTKALSVPGTVNNEQFIEENEVVKDTAGIVEIDDEATKETTPEETKESVSNEEEDIKPDPEIIGGKDKNTKLDANAKVHTQEFGNPDAGEPIVAKTYNFDEPNVEAGREPVNLKLPVDSARKVMLF